MKTKNDNFQRNLLISPKCEGCDEQCEVLYDAHHDEYFSENCGLVILQMGVYLIDYCDYDIEDF